MKRYPSIFNDVIGPVMRGPSSSHTAAALRIATLARMLLGDRPVRALFEFAPDGSLATTYASQGSDIGLAGGLLGYSLSDERLLLALEQATCEGLVVEFRISDFSAEHPNTYKVSLWGERGTSLELLAVSTGGGMMEVHEVDGIALQLLGDCYELLLLFAEPLTAEEQAELLAIDLTGEAAEVSIDARCAMFHSAEPFSAGFIDKVARTFPAARLRSADPVVPTRYQSDCKVPFLSATELQAYAQQHQVTELWELAARYESARGGQSEIEVLEEMHRIVAILKSSVASGRKGTQFADRILEAQAPAFMAARSSLVPGGAMNTVMEAVIALMDVKSSMGIIVAAPTAGSCAALPGAVLGVAEAVGADDEACARALLAAGLIGVFIAQRSTFSAELAGCQAECGAASGMAAAAVLSLMNAPLEVCLTATSLALQNILGMICDPVARRVEVPCMGKNVMAAVNALACANMALAGLPPVIPLDEVIAAMDAVGKALPRELRCTGLGGLSQTPSSLAIEQRLAGSAQD